METFTAAAGRENSAGVTQVSRGVTYTIGVGVTYTGNDRGNLHDGVTYTLPTIGVGRVMLE